jgi:site-specific DNA recombinase
MPPAATIGQVAEYVDQVIGAGTHSQRKALIEALVAQVKITGPGRIVLVFRIPQLAREPDPVRAMTNLVGPVGLEPTLASS